MKLMSETNNKTVVYTPAILNFGSHNAKSTPISILHLIWDRLGQKTGAC